MTRKRVAAAVMALAISGCTAAPVESRDYTWLSVNTVDWAPDESLSLEIGGDAWLVPPGEVGVVTPNLEGPTELRLIGADSCRTYASFEIRPLSAHTIEFRSDGSVAVADALATDHPSGPGLPERDPSGCPANS